MNNALAFQAQFPDGSTKYQSMTCDVRLQLAEVRCAVASCDVLAIPTLVVTCDVSACGAFLGLRSAIKISHIILAIIKEIGFLLV
jgi:hypothetical protein